MATFANKEITWVRDPFPGSVVALAVFLNASLICTVSESVYIESCHICCHLKSYHVKPPPSTLPYPVSLSGWPNRWSPEKSKWQYWDHLCSWGRRLTSHLQSLLNASRWHPWHILLSIGVLETVETVVMITRTCVVCLSWYLPNLLRLWCFFRVFGIVMMMSLTFSPFVALSRFPQEWIFV